MAPALEPRQYYCNGYNYSYNYNCNTSAFSSYGRWILLGAVIVAALLFFLAFSCLSARRRKRQGLQPYRMTGWAHQGQWNNNTQSQYQPPVQPYGNNNPSYYNNNAGTPNNAPPTYEPPKQGNYYGNGNTNGGANESYFGGQQSGIELQQPNNSYQPRGGENVYSAPDGPPPAKGDGIIR